MKSKNIRKAINLLLTIAFTFICLISIA